jgi:hypothetical protein
MKLFRTSNLAIRECLYFVILPDNEANLAHVMNHLITSIRGTLLLNGTFHTAGAKTAFLSGPGSRSHSSCICNNKCIHREITSRDTNQSSCNDELLFLFFF